MEKKKILTKSPQKVKVGQNYRYMIGSGSYGVVFSLDLVHAIKSFAIMELEWIREIAVTKFLEHPSIISYENVEIVLDYNFNLDKKKYSTKKVHTTQAKMKYYSTSLNNLEKFADSEIFLILNNIGSALSQAHKKNVLHRDLKECNILVNCKDGHISEVILCDFGLGKYVIESDTHPEYEMITISHRPPELELSLDGNNSHVIESRISKEPNKCNFAKNYDLRFRYDHRVDIWSYCITLVFLITGKQFYNYVHTEDLNFSEILKDLDVFLGHLQKFIRKNLNRELKHITFYLKILNLGLSKYEDRPSIDELLTEINKYVKENSIVTNGTMFEAPNSQETFQRIISVSDTNKTRNNIEFYYHKKKTYKKLCTSFKKLWMPHIADIDFFTILSEKNIDTKALYMALNNLFYAIIKYKEIISRDTNIIVSDGMLYAGCYVLVSTILVDNCNSDPVYSNLVDDHSIFQIILKILDNLKYNFIGHLGFSEISLERLKTFVVSDVPKNTTLINELGSKLSDAGKNNKREV
jgi:serine/threonine protein kinase